MAERAIFPLSSNPNFYKSICNLDLILKDELEVGFLYTIKNNIFQDQGIQYELAIYIYGEYRRQGFGKSALFKLLSEKQDHFVGISKNNIKMQKMIYEHDFLKVFKEDDVQLYCKVI
jgi:predicted acetyltransferase